MIIYTIATNKGGTGKTTTTAALAQAAAYKGQRVLAVDMDPQSNLTYCLDALETLPGSYHLLHGMPIDKVIQSTKQNIAVISASPELQTETIGKGTALRLMKALETVQTDYDVCFIDTPATPGELQYNALMAADRLLIPLETDSYNLQSLKQIMLIAEAIQQNNPGLKIAGVLLTIYDGQPIINRQLRDLLEQRASAMGIPFLGTVRKAIAIKEAAALQVSIFEYAPKSNPAIDYMRVYEAITK